MAEPDAWSRALLAASGLLGLGGVSLGAAGAHLGGGELVRLASEFLLFHAAAMPGLLALRWAPGRLLRLAATCLGLGATLFGGDLATHGFTGHAPISGMAPSGGILMMLGWLLVAVCAVPKPRGPISET